MQNENNKRNAGRGYYIALIACIAAVGISGYVFLRTATESAIETAAPAEISATVSPRAEASASPSENQKQGAKDPQETEAPKQAAATIMWPLEGDVLSTFSTDTLTYSETMEDWRTHEGLDISAALGDDVCATEAGTITAVYKDDFLGNVVVVSHQDDVSTLYANLTDTPAVAVGDAVVAGDVLGQVGSSALLEIAEPCHLHFEVYENGNPSDPLNYLPE